MERSYKYRIYPNKTQKELIHKTFGCVRFVYNYYLNKRIEKYEKEKITFNFYDCSKDLTQLKKEFEWLKEPDKDALQKALKDLDWAFKYFFKNNHNFPKFKSKKTHFYSYRTSCTYNNIRYENKHIKLPKLGFIKTRDKRVPEGRILNATVTLEPNGHYYCSLCCTDIEIKSLPKTGVRTGIDLGIKDYVIFSNGEKIENPCFYEKSEQKLAKLYRELSRKPIDSKRREKARLKAAKLARHIFNQRTDFLQKLSTDIIKNYDIICIEDLDIKYMLRKGKSIRNKHLNDVSWRRFRDMLTYKCEWYGKTLSMIDRYYPSSQICHCCGVREGKKPEDIREWVCPNCGAELDRDINAAINILNEGLRILK